MIEKKQKELKTRVRTGTSHFEVYYDNGGELPKDLSGVYTSVREAKKDISKYLSKKNRNATSPKQ